MFGPFIRDQAPGQNNSNGTTSMQIDLSFLGLQDPRETLKGFWKLAEIACSLSFNFTRETSISYPARGARQVTPPYHFSNMLNI
jgi:hypothetical protein